MSKSRSRDDLTASVILEREFFMNMISRLTKSTIFVALLAEAGLAAD